jgi:hypothetical protein
LQAEKRKFKVEIITIPYPYLSGTVDSGNKVLLEIAEMKPIEIGYLNDFRKPTSEQCKKVAQKVAQKGQRVR